MSGFNFGTPGENPDAVVSGLFSEEAKQKFTKKDPPPVLESRKRPAGRVTSEDAKKKKERKPKKPKPSADLGSQLGETNEVFVGNLPLATKKAELERLFKKYGAIASIRLRSVPIAGTAVDEAGNVGLVKKVCAIKGKYSDAKNSVNAYLVFEDASSAHRAISEANGIEYGGHHLRVDNGKIPTFDAARSVFVGNVPTSASEEQLRSHFARLLAAHAAASDPAAPAEAPALSSSFLIQGVRLVRDAETFVGKGFGYVLLRDKAAAAAALSLNGSKLLGRELRVQVCGKRFKGKRGVTGGEEAPNASASSSSSGPAAKTRKERRAEAAAAASAAAAPAAHAEAPGDASDTHASKSAPSPGAAAIAQGGDASKVATSLPFQGLRASGPELTGAARRLNGKKTAGKGAGKLGKGGKGSGRGKGSKGGLPSGKGSTHGKGNKGGLPGGKGSTHGKGARGKGKRTGSDAGSRGDGSKKRNRAEA